MANHFPHDVGCFSPPICGCVISEIERERAARAQAEAERDRARREYEIATGKKMPIASCKGDLGWHLKIVADLDRAKSEIAMLTADLAAARRTRDDAQARARDLEAGLVEAIELAEEGWSYASDYFRDKWGSKERAAKLRALVAPPESGSSLKVEAPAAPSPETMEDLLVRMEALLAEADALNREAAPLEPGSAAAPDKEGGR